MRQAEQTPFATDVLQATKQESAETPCFFDLAKHRFHDHLASAVQRLAFRRPQLLRPYALLPWRASQRLAPEEHGAAGAR